MKLRIGKFPKNCAPGLGHLFIIIVKANGRRSRPIFPQAHLRHQAHSQVFWLIASPIHLLGA